MRSLFVVLLLTATAHADDGDRWQEHQTFGLDVTTLWEPRNSNAFGAGPLMRFEYHSSKVPDWLDMVTRFGVLPDSADRVMAPFVVGALVHLGGPYVTAELGGVLHSEVGNQMSEIRLSWTVAAALGGKLGYWDARATWLRGGMFEGNVWLFSIGRDFGRLDSTVTRTTHW
jgi:hypothetical protein